MAGVTRPLRLASRHARRFSINRVAGHEFAGHHRSFATEAPSPTPPILVKLRQDLKTAMQQKDSVRLSVLRGVLADITNLSKQSATSAPKTDIQVLSVLRKRVADSKRAAHSFGEGGRVDLKDKEDAQIAVLQGYADAVQTVDDEEVRACVGEVITDLSMADTESKKLSKGVVLKKLLGPGGSLEGKPVDRATVAKLVDVAIGDSAAA